MNREELTFLKQNGYYPFPKILQLEITRRCPFHCVQCYKRKLENIDMEYRYLMELLDLIEHKGTRRFVLNGGEPLLYPDIVPLLKRITAMDAVVNIFSSGYSITDEIIELLKESGNIAFYISLNGSTKEINGKSREGYETAVSALAMLASAGVSYGINWVARHDNAADFVNMMELCRAYKAASLSVVGGKLTGGNIMDSPVTRDDLALIASYITSRKETEPHISIESCFSMLSTHTNIPKSGFGAHCYAGISNCNINCDKTFQPCTHLKCPEEYASVEDYWHNSALLKTLRKHPAYTLAPCRTCDHKKICSLCRAMSVETCVAFDKGSGGCVNYSGTEAESA
jgi:pyrroloquinoline quinone biosynthesis protein E